MTEDPRLKARILANRFSDLLREDAVVDESAYAELTMLLRSLALEWQPRSDVDKELAGWILHIVLTVGGARERFARNGARDLAARTGDMMGELYTLADSCFEDEQQG